MRSAARILEPDFVGSKILVADVPDAVVEKFREPTRSCDTGNPYWIARTTERDRSAGPAHTAPVSKSMASFPCTKISGSARLLSAAWTCATNSGRRERLRFSRPHP